MKKEQAKELGPEEGLVLKHAEAGFAAFKFRTEGSLCVRQLPNEANSHDGVREFVKGTWFWFISKSRWTSGEESL